MELRRKLYLLALANTPEGGTSVYDWAPFPGGSTLGQIVEEHNRRCIRGYQDLGLLTDWIERLAEYVRILKRDLSTIEQLKREHFERIRIVVIDLDAIEETAIDMDAITLRMATCDHFFHLAQVSQRPTAVPCTSLFKKLPVIPSTPEILPNQQALERFLSRLCERYSTVVSSYLQPLLQAGPSTALERKARQDYIRALPRIAANVRDTAIMKDLTVALTRREARQQLALTGVAALLSPHTEPETAWRKRLVKIEGIGEVFAQKLRAAGVTSVESLLEKGASPQGRKALAEGTGISDKLILKWVDHADLFRVKGIGEEYSDLLEQAGVATVPELAQRNAANLFAKLGEVNMEKKRVRRLPSHGQVADWVHRAKDLPRVITY
jgi:predicted flap endonuclease-1-like 5' DNA nuclease